MDRMALAGRIIDFGLTKLDLELGQDHGMAGAERDALLETAPRPAGLTATQTELGDLFPAGLRPQPQLISPAPSSSDPLPRADYAVITWTVAEV